MRLLRRLPDGNFELVSFDDDEHTPPYAILSHTWTEREEVTYDEILAGTGTNKRGYAKIRFCGERAAAEGLDYFWVDTCCINKAVSDELSTAINSMFRWYQRAAKCYVYLTDVPVPEEVVDAEAYPISWRQAFRRSRWFTRGWTLQELLAPTSVEFFSQDGDGKRLGSRISLERDIHEITRIPVRALRGLSSEFSVEERMGWAARRRTTKREDKAYCLLGIFGVFLPLIYGEGEAHAMLRLKEEIEKRQKERAVINLQDRTRAREVSPTNLVARAVEHSTVLDVDDDLVDVFPLTRHNVEAALANFANERSGGLDWQHSVVDLLKLLNLRSDARFREWLADTLGVRAGPTGSRRQDNALHDAIVEELAEAELAWVRVMDFRLGGDQCMNCGSSTHWERDCKPQTCGKCTSDSCTACSCFDR